MDAVDDGKWHAQVQRIDPQDGEVRTLTAWVRIHADGSHTCREHYNYWKTFEEAKPAPAATEDLASCLANEAAKDRGKGRFGQLPGQFEVHQELVDSPQPPQPTATDKQQEGQASIKPTAAATVFEKQKAWSEQTPAAKEEQWQAWIEKTQPPKVSEEQWQAWIQKTYPDLNSLQPAKTVEEHKAWWEATARSPQPAARRPRPTVRSPQTDAEQTATSPRTEQRLAAEKAARALTARMSLGLAPGVSLPACKRESGPVPPPDRRRGDANGSPLAPLTTPEHLRSTAEGGKDARISVGSAPGLSPPA